MTENSSSETIRYPSFGLISLFLVIFLVISCSGYLFYRLQEQNLRDLREKSLQAIADLKSNEISRWRVEKIRDAKFIMESSFVWQILETAQAEGGNEATNQMLAVMKNLAGAYEYENVYTVDASGALGLSLDGKGLNTPDEIRSFIMQTIQAGKPSLTNLFLNSETQKPEINLIAPLVQDASGAIKILGGMIFCINPEDFLFPLLQTWPTPSDTAETLLVTATSDSVCYLNELRHQKGTALKLKLPISQTELPAVKAVLGYTGVARGVDYRGVEVLAAVERVPDSPWHIVAKMDQSEALAIWKTRSRMILSFILILLLAIFTVFCLAWQRQKSSHFRDLYNHEVERKALQMHYEYLVRYANDIILLSDNEGNLIEANERAVSAYGYSQAELQTIPLTALVDPREHEAHLANLQKAADSGSVLYETVHQRKDGSLFPVEVSSRFIDVDGTTRLQNIIRDISERKIAERERNLLFKTISASMNEIFMFDAATLKFSFVNAGALHNLGYSLQEIQTMTPIDIKPEHTLETFAKLTAPLLSGEKTIQQFQTVHQRANGSLYWVDVHLQLFDHGDEKIYLAIIQDITEKKQTELIREDLLRSLKEKTDDMESILYVSSHDLRSPLLNIQGFSSRLEKYSRELNDIITDSSAPDSLKKMAVPIVSEKIPLSLRFITQSAAKMDLLINGLLKISRLGRITLAPTLLDMNKMVESVLATFRHQINEAGAEVIVQDLPQCFADAGQMNQVVANLIENALKYRSPIRPLQVTISGKIQDNMAVYGVRDNGIGIKPEYLNKIWELFSRLDPNSNISGEGLGLTVVNRIIQRHRGHAWAESEPDRGSCFYIAIPVAVSESKPSS